MVSPGSVLYQALQLFVDDGGSGDANDDDWLLAWSGSTSLDFKFAKVISWTKDLVKAQVIISSKGNGEPPVAHFSFEVTSFTKLSDLFQGLEIFESLCIVSSIFPAEVLQ